MSRRTGRSRATGGADPRWWDLRRALALCAAFASLPALAAPGDGVVEIHHSCAVRTGCFSGDDPGYPVTIDGTAGHSYRLTSDLVVPDESTTAIRVEASDIAIDLAGFTITRSGCADEVGSCLPAVGTGSGVAASSNLLEGVAVHGGTIAGMGRHGVWLGRQAHVRDLRVRWNGWSGITVGHQSLVDRNAAYENGLSGIVAGEGARIAGNVSFGNEQAGITAAVGSLISGNVVARNGGPGISAGPGCEVVGNTAYRNQGDGVLAAGGSAVSGNTVYANGDSGIYAFGGSMVRHNAARSNTGLGLRLGTGAAYADNALTANGAGTVSAGGANLGGNLCETNSSCP